MITHLKFILFIPLIAFLSYQSDAENGKKKNMKNPDKRVWKLIGEKTVDFVRDRDELKVDGDEHFEFVKIVATDAPIYLNNLVVTFETGNDQAVTIKDAIKIPGESKIFRVTVPIREIRKIYFVYSTIPNARDKKAHLEIYGSKLKLVKKKAIEAVAKEVKETQEVNTGPALVLSDKTGWQKIGSRMLDLKVGKDEVTVLGADRFAIIKFRLINGTVNLVDTEFQYESGDAQSNVLNRELVDGMESAPINLNGGERSLKKIVFNYKSGKGNYDNEAEVEIWGYKSNSDQTSK